MAKFFLFGEYLTSSLLFQDDTIFLGHYLFGVAIESPPTQAFYYGLVEAITSIGGVFGAKFSLLLVQFGISLFAYLVINQFARAKVVALGLSVVLMHYPVAVDQNFFVIGAHPQFGILALFLGIYCLLRGPVLGGDIFAPKPLILALFAGVCFVVGARSSPTFILMPALFLVVLVFMLLEHGIRSQFDSRHLCAGAILSAVSGVLIFRGSNYHYSSIQGWVDVSSDQVLENLVAAMSTILMEPFEGKVWFLVICSAGLVIFVLLATLALRARPVGAAQVWANNRRLLFLGFLVVCAACVFGPGSVTTSYLDRYVIAPYSFLALVFGCLIGWAFKVASSRMGGASRVSVFIALGVVSGAVILAAGTTTRDTLSPYQEAHTATLQALDSFNFEHDDQILVLLPDSAYSPTSGFNHWSTWYLRVLTKNASIIGLVGTKSMYDPNFGPVFVDKYRDHDANFWAVRDGRSFRVQMVGLEKDRRLFTFLSNSDGELEPGATVVADQKGEIKRVNFGERFTQVLGVSGSLKQICKPTTSESGHFAQFVDDRSQDIGRAIFNEVANAPVARRVELLNDAFEADGEVEQRVDANLAIGEFAQIELLLKPKIQDAGAGPYSEVFPPMPLLSSTIAIYHIGNGLRITTREEPSQSFYLQLEQDEVIELKILGCVGGRAAIMFGNEIIGSTFDFSPDGEWILGKGFLRRYWQGEFQSFVVTHYLATRSD